MHFGQKILAKIFSFTSISSKFVKHFSTLKNELVNRSNFQTRKERIAAVPEYIEVFFNIISPHFSIY
ncbi:IS3 family transposase [Pigmentibacter ruber]